MQPGHNWRYALRRKDWALAEQLLSQAVAANQRDLEAWRELALLMRRLGRPADAVRAFESAFSAGLPIETQLIDYALSLSQIGRTEQALDLVRAAMQRRQRDSKLINLFGILLRRAGRLTEALTAFEEVRKLDPKNPSLFVNLGNTWFEVADYGKSAEAYQRAIRLDPRNAENWRLLGRAQRRGGDTTSALASARRAVFLEPRNADAISDLAGYLLDARLFDEALALVERALSTVPHSARLLSVKAGILSLSGRQNDAKTVAEEALAHNPTDSNALYALARTLGRTDRRAANDYFERAVAADPASIEIAVAYCDSLNRSRYDNEADHIEKAYRLAADIIDRSGLKARRNSPYLRSISSRCVDFARLNAFGSVRDLAPLWLDLGSATAFHYDLGFVQSFNDRLALVEWHRTWGRRVASGITPIMPQGAPAITGRAKARVGFMSSDLREHPVGYFALPLLEFYDRDRFEVFCYSFSQRQRDRAQAFIEKQVDGFRWWPGKTNAEVAEGIASDKLDMLFELGGSTDMNKLEVMAYRPARLCASWLGYPHSSGLETIDYILVDPYIKPEDPRLLIEQPFEMPETWVAISRFINAAIDPAPPSDRTGHVTFGTMNNPYKYNPALFDAWAKVMGGVAGSRFLFVRPEGGAPSFRTNVMAEFERRGIAGDRISFVPVRGTHMAHYNAIDVALDTFPHVGGTTTCETLWMGVPVVTLVGPAFFERLSYSNLSNAGLGALCAFTVEAYVQKAIDLAGDMPQRRALRGGLRRMIADNPLGRPERFSKAFYQAVDRVVRQ